MSTNMMSTSIKLTKKRIRSKMLLKLKIQKEEGRNRKSRLIQKKLFRTIEFRKAKNIMFYVSFDGEVKTQGMIKEAIRLGKTIAVPVCTKNRMLEACLLEVGAKLVRGPYGTWEPASQRCLNSKTIDLVVVPGLAFDKRGNRLGRGRGYYDRFLGKLKAKSASVGLAFDFQILPAVPATKKDVAVQRVISN
ncbi:MAG: 5-formyltetrahydrofolate cyclo-ligase [Candidatus Omnitrophota bacterium]